MVNLCIMALIVQREINWKKVSKSPAIVTSVYAKTTTPWNVQLMKPVPNVQTILVNVLEPVTMPTGNTPGACQELNQNVNQMIPVPQTTVQPHTTAQHHGLNGVTATSVSAPERGHVTVTAAATCAALYSWRTLKHVTTVCQHKQHLQSVMMTMKSTNVTTTTLCAMSLACSATSLVFVTV